ncbi:MAG: large ribosomal subunit protein uL16, partial [bacterium]
MALIPTRVKYRKQQRGRMKGVAIDGNYVAFGEYGLQALEPAWITSAQLEAVRIVL